MSDFAVKRAFYDALSIVLPCTLFIYLALSRLTRLKAINLPFTLLQTWLDRRAPFAFDTAFLIVIGCLQ